MEETKVIEMEATEVIENTELATCDTEVFEESNDNGGKIAAAAGIATVLVGGFLIGKKIVKKCKAKKAAADNEAKVAEDSLDIMCSMIEEKEKEIEELKAKIESLVPQKFEK